MTDVLATIDATIDDWEASPHSWVPGDPLHNHPHSRPYGDGNCVRPLFDVIDDVSWLPARCEPCQVSWSGPDPCWECGQERPPTRARPTSRAVEMRVTVETSRALQQMQESMAAAAATISRVLDDRLPATLAAYAEARRPEPPRPRPAMSRCFLAPAIADPAAPTRAELAAAADIGDLVLGFDRHRPDVPPVVAVVRRPPVPHMPARLPIDGAAYRRRTRARRRNR